MGCGSSVQLNTVVPESNSVKQSSGKKSPVVERLVVIPSTPSHDDNTNNSTTNTTKVMSTTPSFSIESPPSPQQRPMTVHMLEKHIRATKKVLTEQEQIDEEEDEFGFSNNKRKTISYWVDAGYLWPSYDVSIRGTPTEATSNDPLPPITPKNPDSALWSTHSVITESGSMSRMQLSPLPSSVMSMSTRLQIPTPCSLGTESSLMHPPPSFAPSRSFGMKQQLPQLPAKIPNRSASHGRLNT